MCIIFVWSDPACLQGDYKLVIAANRDEQFLRPTLPANFLADNPNILCGVDMESGVEGGTWLGVTKTGKFAFLTNYLTPSVVKIGRPRGSIVSEYLKSNSAPRDYIDENLANVSYRPFHFVGGQIKNSSESKEIEMCYYAENDPQSPMELGNGTHTLACTSMGCQWNKVKHGSDRFQMILQENLHANPSEFSGKLIEDLLSDKTNLYPDSLVESQCNSRMLERTMRSYCSVMIAGLEKYGTRAQTTVLVDKNDHLFFTERSLDVDEKHNHTWIANSYDFLIEY